MRKAFFVALFIFGFLIPTSVSAQKSETSISVAPAILELAGNPGETIQRTLYVQNTGPFSIPVTIEVNSLLSGSDEIIDSALLKYDAKNWITIQEDRFILDSTARKEIPVSIVIPDTGTAGGHYAQISIRGLSIESERQQTSSIVVPEVNVSVLITVDGDINESLEIERTNLLPTQASPNSEHDIKFSVTNTGNVHGLVAPELVLEKNGIEQILKFAPRVLLPGAKVEFAQIWTSPEDYGSYKANIRIRYGNEGRIYQTPEERIFITPSYTKLIFTAAAAWLFIYSYRHRFTIVPAFEILIMPNKTKKQKKRKKTVNRSSAKKRKKNQ